MPRKPSSQLNDVELAILRVLWDRGPSSVRQVHDVMQNHRDAGYTSTLKMMQVMVEKGLLHRDGLQRPHLYQPAVPEDQTQNRIIRDLIRRVFDGSARKLVVKAVESQRLSKQELSEIRQLLDKLEGDQR